MKTNLIFKRQVTTNGVTKVVTRIVPVDVPMINSGDGWILSGHSDTIETCEDVYIHRLAPSVTYPTSEQLRVDDSFMTPLAAQMIETINNRDDPSLRDVTKFESDVVGTAKLVRVKGVIKIVARRGKTTYNQTNPNSVCINDFTKNEFFKNCRERFGNGTSLFEFKPSDGRCYDYWNDIIDKEYQRQKKVFINKEMNKK